MARRNVNLILTCIVLFSFLGLAQVIAQEEPPIPELTQEEQNKAVVVREFEEVWNQQQLDVIDEIYDPNIIFHDPAETGFNGTEGLRQFVNIYITGFPDVNFVIDDQFADGDKVVTIWTATGTHKGDLMGIPPTDVFATTVGINIAHLSDGKIVEEWAHWDALGQMQQLGVIEADRPGPEGYLWGEPSTVTGDPGDAEANKALVMRYTEECWNQGNIDVVDEIFSPDVLEHDPVGRHLYSQGIDGLKESIAEYRTAFPDFHGVVEDIIAKGDMVVGRWVATGTFLGELTGIPPSGQKATWTGITAYRMADGMIVELWWAYDALGLIQQITAPTQEEQNKALVRDGYYDEIWSKGNLDKADEIIAPDYAFHGPSIGELSGPDQLKQLVVAYRQAFPDMTWTVHDQIAEGDIVLSRVTGVGTHLDAFRGIPATNKVMSATGISFARVADGKITETWTYVDLLGVMQQMGVMEPGRPTPEDYMWKESSEVTGDPGTPEANKAIVMRYAEECWNQGDLDVLDEVMSPDIAGHNPVADYIYGDGLDPQKQAITDYRTAFPDLHSATEFIMAEGDKVAARWTATGTFEGELLGIPPSGNKITWSGSIMYRLADGKIVETWWAYDALGLMQQLAIPSQEERNKALERRVFEEIWNQGKLDVADEIFAPDVVMHGLTDADMTGPAAFKQMVAMYRAAFPDLLWTVEDQIAEGDMVTTRLTGTGTHTNQFMNIPATGATVTVTTIAIVRIVNGKIQESWNNYDALGLMQQLGVMPSVREDYTWGVPSEVTGDPGDPETNKAIVQRMIDEVFKGNLDVIDELFATDYVMHDPASPMEVRGPEGFKRWAGTMLEPYFSDGHIAAEDVIAEGDKVVVRWLWSGTHTGEFMSIPATGRQVTVTGISIHRFADSKFVESWVSYDTLGMMRQLTAPEPVKAGSVSFDTWLSIVKKHEFTPEQRLDGLYLVMTKPVEVGGNCTFVYDDSGDEVTFNATLTGEFQELKVNYDEEGKPVSASGPAQGSLKMVDSMGNVAFYGKYSNIHTMTLGPGFIPTGLNVAGYVVCSGVGANAGIHFRVSAEGNMAPNPQNPDEIGYRFYGKGRFTKHVIASEPPTGHHVTEVLFRYPQDYGLVPEQRADDLYLVSTRSAIALGEVRYIFDNGEEITGNVVASGTSQELKVIFDENGVPLRAAGLSCGVTVRGSDSYGNVRTGVMQMKTTVHLTPDMKPKAVTAEATGVCQLEGVYGDYIAIDRFIATSIPDPDDPTKVAYKGIGEGQMTKVTGLSSVGMYSMNLAKGLNIVSLPLDPVDDYTARSLAEELGATMVIKLDSSSGEYIGFTPAAPDDGFDIEAGKGYIVNVLNPMTVEFMGTIWNNTALHDFSAAPPVNNSAWAFVVSGSVLDGEDMSAKDGGYIVVARNLRTGSATTRAADVSGYFAATWTDISRKPVIESSDKVEVSVIDSRGKVVSGPFVHEITPGDIQNAVKNVQLRLGDIIPEKSALLQNYPNPFNPETWIPYQLNTANPVVIRIYSANGQLVKTLDLGYREAGMYVSRSKAAYWDGKNEAGEEVASGIYFYSVTTKDFSATRKMVIKK